MLLWAELEREATCECPNGLWAFMGMQQVLHGKELERNLVWSCFCLFVSKLQLKERKIAMKVQLSRVGFWRNLLE